MDLFSDLLGPHLPLVVKPYAKLHLIHHFSSLSSVRILATVINPAKRGDAQGISFLIGLIQTPQGVDYIITALDIYISHLESPSSGQSPKDVGLLSLFGVPKLMRQVYIMAMGRSDPQSKRLLRLVVLRLATQWDIIGRWMLLSLGKSTSLSSSRNFVRYVKSATMLIEVALHIPALCAQIQSSEALLDVIIHLWLMKNKDVDCSEICKDASRQPYKAYPDDYFITPYADYLGASASTDPIAQEGCSMLVIFKSALIQKQMREKLISRWIAYFSELTVHGRAIDPYVFFAKTVLARVGQVHLASQARSWGTVFALNNIASLATIVKLFINHPEVAFIAEGGNEDHKTGFGLDPWSYKFYLALYKAGFALEFTKAIRAVGEQGCVEEVSCKFSEKPPGQYAIPLIAMTLQRSLLFQHIYSSYHHFADKCRAMIKGGLFQIVLYAALTLGHYSEEYRASISTVEDWAATTAQSLGVLSIHSTVFPGIASSAHSAIKTLSLEEWEAIEWVSNTSFGPLIHPGLASSSWTKEFKNCWGELDRHSKTFRKRWSHIICDSARHHTSGQQSSGQEKNVRACSGCLFNVYCSSECQKDDWDRHRGECKGIRTKLMPGPEDNATFYRPLDRAWHIHLIRASYISSGSISTRLPQLWLVFALSGFHFSGSSSKRRTINR